MAARGGGSTRWASQAAQDALLKFSPQRTSLADALRAAQETYGQTVQAGNTSAKLTQAAARAAYPAIGQIYAKADAGTQAGQTLVNSDLAGLPGVANQYKADQAGEVQQQLANLLAARSSDQAMLTNQGTAAAAGAQFNQTNARQALQKTVAGLISKSQTTSQEQGAFAASEAERLAHEAETLDQREAASVRSANTSRSNNAATNATSTANSVRSTSGAERRSERSAASKGGAPGGVKPLTTEAMNKAASTLRAIEHEARAMRQAGLQRGQIYSELTSDHPSVNVVKTDENGHEIKNAKGEKQYQAAPALKAHDVLLSEAALDSVFGYGRVSKGTLQKLHSAGYSIKGLGLEGPAPAPPAAPLPYPKSGGRPGARHPGR